MMDPKVLPIPHDCAHVKVTYLPDEPPVAAKTSAPTVAERIAEVINMLNDAKESEARLRMFVAEGPSSATAVITARSEFGISVEVAWVQLNRLMRDISTERIRADPRNDTVTAPRSPESTVPRNLSALAKRPAPPHLAPLVAEIELKFGNPKDAQHFDVGQRIGLPERWVTTREASADGTMVTLQRGDTLSTPWMRMPSKADIQEMVDRNIRAAYGLCGVTQRG